MARCRNREPNLRIEWSMDHGHRQLRGMFYARRQRSDKHALQPQNVLCGRQHVCIPTACIFRLFCIFLFTVNARHFLKWPYTDPSNLLTLSMWRFICFLPRLNSTQIHVYFLCNMEKWGSEQEDSTSMCEGLATFRTVMTFVRERLPRDKGKQFEQIYASRKSHYLTSSSNIKVVFVFVILLLTVRAAVFYLQHPNL